MAESPVHSSLRPVEMILRLRRENRALKAAIRHWVRVKRQFERPCPACDTTTPGADCRCGPALEALADAEGALARCLTRG